MSKTEKLLQRLLSLPNDFTWEELVKILTHFGYTELRKGKTGGSRRKFIDSKNNVLGFHKPHPGNIIKIYVLKKVVWHLREKGYLKDE